MEKIIKKIESLPLFMGISGQSLLTLFKGIQFYEKHYAKGSALILQGMPYKALYVLTQGECVGQMSGASGKILKIEDFEAPYALAGPLLFADDNRLPVTLWAKTDVDVLILKKNDLLMLCQKNQQFLINLFNDVANKFTFISSKLMYLQFKSLDDKILFFLNSEKADASGWVTLKQSIQELSTLFGVERPSLSRALSRMENEGMIQKAGKKIRISG